MKAYSLFETSMIVTGNLASYATTRSFELNCYKNERIIFSKGHYLNLILYRLLDFLKIERLRFNGKSYYFGYFQNICEYDKVVLEGFLKSLDTIGVIEDVDADLIHVRMTDFQNSDGEIVRFINSCQNTRSATYITDDEPRLKLILANMGLKANVYSTEGFSAQTLLKVMSGFRSIQSNGSTLAFWASLVGKKPFTSTEEVLQSNYNYIND